jgi:YesN/AraC family two-component response regulator
MIDITNMKEIVSYSKTLSVLYVEDNTDIRRATLVMLGNFFESITIGINGQDGLDKFPKSSYDLVLSDINMPVMNGIDMIKNIRLLDKDVSIIMISAHNEANFKKDASKYNIDDYMIKPTSFKDFIRVLTFSIEKIYYKNNN